MILLFQSERNQNQMNVNASASTKQLVAKTEHGALQVANGFHTRIGANALAITMSEMVLIAHTGGLTLPRQLMQAACIRHSIR